MATFTNETPPRLKLTAYEDSVRAQNRKGDGPVPYTPIPQPPDIYTHIGHAINYGKGRRNNRTIRLIIWHTTEGGDNFLGNMAYEAHRAETVSATAFVGPNGELGYDTPEQDRAWTTGRWNDEAITAEVIGRAAWTAAQWRARPKQIDAMIDLCTDWCSRYNIPTVWLNPSQVAEGASRQSTTPVQGVNRGNTDHWDANQAARILGASSSSTSHTDIGPGLREVISNDVLPEAARRLRVPAPPPVPASHVQAEESMLNFEINPSRFYDSRTDGGNLKPGDKPRKIALPKMSFVFGGTVGVVRNTGDGYVTVAGTEAAAAAGTTSVASFDSDGRANGYIMVGTPTGHLYVAAHGGPCDVSLDLNVWGSGTPT